MSTPFARANRAPIFGDIAERIARYRTYRTTLNELQTLSDRDLSDLGISRGEMRSIAYRAAYDG